MKSKFVKKLQKLELGKNIKTTHSRGGLFLLPTISIIKHGEQSAEASLSAVALREGWMAKADKPFIAY